MSRHRILILGAPGSGRSWLARRIHDLTGIPVHAAGPQVPHAEHEWIVVAELPEGCAAEVERADLIVLVRTPRWLRALRLGLADLPFRTRPAGWRGFRSEWRASRAWDGQAGPRWGRLLGTRQGGADLIMKCGSSDDVRAVLERIFGLDASGDPAFPGRFVG